MRGSFSRRLTPRTPLLGAAACPLQNLHHLLPCFCLPPPLHERLMPLSLEKTLLVSPTGFKPSPSLHSQTVGKSNNVSRIFNEHLQCTRCCTQHLPILYAISTHKETGALSVSTTRQSPLHPWVANRESEPLYHTACHPISSQASYTLTQPRLLLLRSSTILNCELKH